MVLTWGDTRRDMTMWSAVGFRILDHGSTRSPSQGSTSGAAGLRGCGAATGLSVLEIGLDGAAPLPTCPASPPPPPRSPADIAQHVVLGHPAGQPGALDGADVDVVLGCHLADYRRRFPPEPVFHTFRSAVSAGSISNRTRFCGR